MERVSASVGHTQRSFVARIVDSARTLVLSRLRAVPGMRYVLDACSVVTSFGWLVIAVAIACCVGAITVGWAEAFALSVACVALLVIAIILVAAPSPYRVSLRLAQERVVAGQTALGEIVVENDTSRRGGSEVIELPIGTGVAEFVIPGVAARQTWDEFFSVLTRRRGVIEVGPARTVRSDGLGLLRRVRSWDNPVTLYVHPRTIRIPFDATGFQVDVEGVVTAKLSSSDVSFHALREYVPGDDRRAIHWRSTARIGTLMVRQFEETRRSHLLIVLDLDTDAWASDDEFEIGVSAAASMARAALVDAKEVSVHTQAGHLKTPTPMHAMDSLSGVERVLGAERISALTQRAGTEASQASTAVVISGSRTHLADLHAALTRLPLDMVITGVRIDTESDFELRTLGNTPVVVAPTLDDFAIGMWKALG